MSTLDDLIAVRANTVSSIKTNREYLNGTFVPDFTGINMPDELLNLATNANWCRMVARTFADRVRPVDFQVRGSENSDPQLEEIYRRNFMHSRSYALILEALAIGQAFASASFNPATGKAVVLPEPAEAITVKRDLITNEITAAMRVLPSNSVATNPVNRVDSLLFADPEHVLLYEPYVTTELVKDHGKWVEVRRIEHSLPRPAIVQFTNRVSIVDHNGTSVYEDVKPIQDAVYRTLLNLAAATEVAALPQKVFMGLDPSSLQNADGSAVSKRKMYMDQIIAMGGDVRIGQFSAADLNNFVGVVKMWAELASTASAVPESAFGVTPTANPTSAESQRAAETTLIKASENIIEQLRVPFAELMSVASALEGRQIEAYDINVVFADPSSPTQAQTTDAAVKKFQVGAISRQQVLRDAQYSPQQIERINRELLDESDPLNKAIQSLTSSESDDQDDEITEDETDVSEGSSA